VAAQHQRGIAALRARQGADAPPGLAADDLLARGVGRARRLGEVDRPPVDGAVQVLQPVGDEVLDLALRGGAADGGDGDEPAQAVGQPALVDGADRAPLRRRRPVRHPAESRTRRDGHVVCRNRDRATTSTGTRRP
jgi:hypothetical protein